MLERKNLMKTIQFVLTRSLVVYLLIFMAANRLIDYRSIERSATFKEWHRLFAPQIKELLSPHSKGSAFLSNCISYYESFVDYVPNGAYANDLLGYCYARDGQYDKAVTAYQKMAALKPQVFWYSYNLGVIYQSQKKYPQAEEWLKKARRQSWEETMDYLLEQKALYEGLLGSGVNRKRLEERFLQARYHTYQLLILINARVKDHEDMLAMAEEAIAQGLDGQGKFSFYAGLAAFKLGRYDQALKFFGTCIDKEFLPGQVNSYRAKSLEALGRKEEAGILKGKAVAYNEEELGHYLQCYPAQAQLF